MSTRALRKTNRDHCPKCSSNNIHWELLDQTEANEIYQKAKCMSCNTNFTEVYMYVYSERHVPIKSQKKVKSQ